MNRFVIPTALALLTLLGMFPSAFATHSRPYEGRLSGTLTIGTGEASGTSSGTGTGYESHLGNVNWTSTSTITGAAQQCAGGFTENLQTTTVAANGDKLYHTATDVVCPTSTPGTFHVTATETIAGGTGRFTQATGSDIADITVVQTSPTGGTLTGTFEGTINY